MTHLDTSVLVDALTGPRRSAAALRAGIASGERLAISTLVLYEWMRGPRAPAELDAQAQLLPADEAVAFDARAAARAAALYRQLRRPRGRELDLAIAACALVHEAKLWTLNRGDFDDIPGLALYDAESTDAESTR
jgi:predicted nucleic acid-binding protein